MSSGPRMRRLASIGPAEPTDIVDKSSARRAMAAAVVAIGRAADPLAEFKSRQAVLEAAMARLGRDFDAGAFLESCGVAAETVAPAVAEDCELPADAVDQLGLMLARAYDAEPSAVRVSDVAGSEAEGYDFTVELDDRADTYFAISFQGQWVFAPGPIGREDLVAVTLAFRKHFDFIIAVGMHLRGASDDSIARVRADIVPRRVLPPGEEDPRSLCDEMPMVFELHNPTGNDRGYYCGYDPFSGDTRPYDE